MRWPRNFGYSLTRESLDVILFFLVPVIAYFIAITTYSFFQFENTSIIYTLCWLPTLLAFFNHTVQTQGSDAGHRYFVIILFLFFAFLIQCASMIFRALKDFDNPRRRKHFLTLYEVFMLSILGALVYAFFFASEFTVNLHSRMGRAMNNTDLKFVLVAGIFYFIRFVPYQFGLVIARLCNIFNRALTKN